MMGLMPSALRHQCRHRWAATVTLARLSQGQLAPHQPPLPRSPAASTPPPAPASRSCHIPTTTATRPVSTITSTTRQRQERRHLTTSPERRTPCQAPRAAPARLQMMSWRPRQPLWEAQTFLRQAQLGSHHDYCRRWRPQPATTAFEAVVEAGLPMATRLRLRRRCWRHRACPPRRSGLGRWAHTRRAAPAPLPAPAVSRQRATAQPEARPVAAAAAAAAVKRHHVLYRPTPHQPRT